MTSTETDPAFDAIASSDALHRRVRDFAEGKAEDTFEKLALDIFSFQADSSIGYRRLLKARSKTVRCWQDIPPVPVQAFRLARVAIHPARFDEAQFISSGTTSATKSTHAMRTTATYDALSLIHGRRALRPEWAGRSVVVALAAHPGNPATSSLGHMMRHFMTHFDGLALANEPQGLSFEPDSPQRWLLHSSGIDVAGLRRAARIAKHREQSLLVLATSFALAMLLDAIMDEPVDCPRRTLVMQTGGFKGRTREISPAALRKDVATAFRIPEAHVVSEYGMTELTSQLYDGPLPQAELAGEFGIYLPPPWLRAVPVDPVSLEPTSPGTAGLAKFVDLGNIDSAVAIVTEDMIRTRGEGIELLGRRQGAPARGCSLNVESLFVSQSSS